MIGMAHQVFDPSDIGQIGQRFCGPKAAQKLGHLVAIEQLNLSDEALGLSGAWGIAGLLRMSTVLVTLLLSGTGIGAEGLDAIAPALAGSKSDPELKCTSHG